MTTDLSLDVDYFADLPCKSLLEAGKAAKKARATAEKFLKAVQDHVTLFNALEALDIDVGFSLDSESIDIRFSGDSDRFTAVWMLLHHDGWSPDRRPKLGTNEPEFATFWRHPEYVKFWFNFSSTVCKRVQTGTKLVEHPIYEIQCGELLSLEAQNAIQAE